MDLVNKMIKTKPLNDKLCACQSGLLAKACCDNSSFLFDVSKEKLFDVSFNNCLGLYKQKKLSEARQGCLDILNKLPAHTKALRLLYLLHKTDNKTKATEILLRRLLVLLPNDEKLYCDLAMILYQRGDNKEAELNARNVVRLNPNNAEGHNLMGMIMSDIHRLQAGEYHYRKALELHEPLGKLCANLGLNLKKQGKLQEAEAVYAQALELEPDNSDSLLGWVRLKEVAKDLKGAWKLLERAEQLRDKDDLSIAITRSKLHCRDKNYDKALAALKTLDLGKELATPTYYYELGDVLDKLGHYDDAFNAYSKANQVIREMHGKKYNKETTTRLAYRLKHFFTKERINTFPQVKTHSENKITPIFIVGFPRSGTTLVEQMLSMHPKISAGDELPFIGDLIQAAPKMLNSNLYYPECLADLCMGDNQSTLESLRYYYLRKVEDLGIINKGVTHFTDKMPLNETHLGLINLIFPDAPIIHLIRHPLDVVLSCFFNDLTHGSNCSYDLESAAYHFQLVHGLVEHYKENLTMKYLPVHYEELVEEPEKECRKIIEHVGLRWSKKCLSFNESERYARTASYAQVTEKVYTDSINRYKNYKNKILSIQKYINKISFSDEKY